MGEGADKALIVVDGVPMAERVASALATGGCDPVVFIGGAEASLRAIGRPWHADRWPGEGPLGGVISALEALGQDCVVAACDLVDLDGASVAALADAASDDVDAVVARTDRIEPMLTWWRQGAAGPLTAQFESGVRALHDALDSLRVVEVAVDPALMRNVNCVEDLPATHFGRGG